MTTEARTLHVTIERPPVAVLAFVRDPENLPAWAPGFAQSVRRDGDGWIAETAEGPMGVEFVPDNGFGIADHLVTVSPGVVVLNPMRVLTNERGSELLFTVFRPGELTDEGYAELLGVVQQDLELLKTTLEGS